jgi:MoaA/NifB/PqqE/SkfB family radical SAM enzyme
MHKLVIETVGYCNLACRMCPTRNYITGKEAMTDEIFTEILHIVEDNNVDDIDLTGWGEPLLDPSLEQRISSIRKLKNNVYIGFNSNGTLLTKQRIVSILNTDLSWMGISFDAAIKETYEKIRVNSSFDTVIGNLKFLSSIRNKKGLRLNVVCVVMKNNLQEMERVVELFGNLGFDTITFKPLDVISSKDNLHLVAEKKSISERFLELQEKYKDQIVVANWNLTDDKPDNDCLGKAASGSIFINCSGDVSPCCYLGHHVPNVKTGLFTQIQTDKFFSFGNILSKHFKEITQSDLCKNFINSFNNGHLPKPCFGCRLVSKKISRNIFNF